MTSKKRLLDESDLYVILDRDLADERGILKIARCVLSAGVSILQLRDKRSSTREMIRTAKALKALTGRFGAALIIDDRIDVALACDADGLHIGQGDPPISLAKKMMGPTKLIGVSVGDLKQAKKAQSQGASYLGAGPIFKTPVKSGRRPKGIKFLNKMKGLGIPVYAIGGIDRSNIRKLVRAGFRKVAVIRAVCGSRDPLRAAISLRGEVNR